MITKRTPFTVFALLLLAAILITPLSGCSGQRAQNRHGADGSRLYSFWPQFPSEPRVQFLTSFRMSSDVELERSAFDQLVYGEKVEVLPISKPYGVEARDGKIYVCDPPNGAVTVLDLVAHQTRVLQTPGLGGMVQPTDICIAQDGKIYVSDLRRGVIFVFGPDERHLSTLGHKGFRPAGIAVHGDELYVSDFATTSVLVLDRSSGSQLRTIGGPGGEDGHFVRPLGIDVDKDGNVYVMDVIMCRLQKFDTYGQFRFAVGQISDTAGSFVRPKLTAVDDEGILYVVDAAFSNVQMFDKDGRILMFFGSSGSHAGAMDMPAGICVYRGDMEPFQEYIHPSFDAERLLLVTNQFGRHKVSVYAMGQLRKGITVESLAGSLADIDPGVTEEGDINPLVGEPGPNADTSNNEQDTEQDQEPMQNPPE